MHQIEFEGQPFCFFISAAAQGKIDRIEQPVYIKMEWFFSCLVRKQVIISEQKPDMDVTEVVPGVYIYFSVMQATACPMSEVPVGQAYSDPIEFPIKKRHQLLPKVLDLDVKKGKLVGQYGKRSQLTS